jgi:hypothetical protein
MTAGNYDFSIEQGASFSRVLTWKDAAETPINLTNYTARMQLREALDASAVLLSLTTENGRIALGGALGTIALSISAVDTAALSKELMKYDLELVSAGGVVTRLLQGNVTLNKEVTR